MARGKTPWTQAEAELRSRPAWLRALGKQDPPEQVEVGGAAYRRTTIYKHDSWSATALYEGAAGRVVCKFQRRQRAWFVPLAWVGWLVAAHERRLLRRLAGVPGVPAWSGEVRVGGQTQRNVVAHAYVPGHPLANRELADEAFFQALRETLVELHRRQVAYVDLHKHENIIVGDDGRPYLVDFQISWGLPNWWPANSWLTRPVLRLLQRTDLYHWQKHVTYRQRLPGGGRPVRFAFTPPWWIRLHRAVAVPFRTARRWLLVKLGIRSAGGLVASERFVEPGKLPEETGATAGVSS